MVGASVSHPLSDLLFWCYTFGYRCVESILTAQELTSFHPSSILCWLHKAVFSTLSHLNYD